MKNIFENCALCGGAKGWDSLSLEEKGYITEQRKRRFNALKLKHTAAKFAGMTHKVWKSEGGTKTRASHSSAGGQI